MHELIVSIDKYIDPDFPGWVLCSLIDAHGNKHVFNEKVPVVTSQIIDNDTRFPCEGRIRCDLVALSPGGPNAMVVVNTFEVDGVESCSGVSEFTVKYDQVPSTNEQ